MIPTAFLYYLVFGITRGGWPPQTCDPLVPDFCTLPIPNNYWLIRDNENNPVHLNFTVNNLPISIDGETTDPTNWNMLDGFNPLPCIQTYWDDLSIENCARLWNIETSVSKDAPVIIIEADTGRLIPYWVELDHSSDNKEGGEANRTMMIWPAFRLEDSTRYIVAIRSMMNNKGNFVGPSEAFVELRDNTTSSNNIIRLSYYNNYIFNILAQHNIQRSSLQLAWDFTVMSTKQQTSTMIQMRDDAYSRIDWSSGGVKYRISSVENNVSEYTYRRIFGYMTIPWYLNMREPDPNVRIVHQWDNPLIPVYQRDDEVQFEILIPRSVANGSQQGKLLQFGHGLFASTREIDEGFAQAIWDEWGYIVGGVNWLGMCFEDVPIITEILSRNLTNFIEIPDRLHQGMLSALMYTKLIISPNFLNDDVFKINGKSVVDTNTPPFYFGISLGGIMGSVFMSLNVDITYGICNVPGFPFSLLLPRSVDFHEFHEILRIRYPGNVQLDLIYTYAQLLWNRLSPAGYVHHLNRDTFIGTPKHNVLLQYSLGDHQVTWLGAEQLGRSLNASMYISNVQEYNETLFGFNWLNDNDVIDINKNPGQVMIQGWNYNEPQVPFINIPPNEGNDTHDDTCQQYDAQNVAQIFALQHKITNQCGGPCNGQHKTSKSQYNWDKSYVRNTLKEMKKRFKK